VDGVLQPQCLLACLHCFTIYVFCLKHCIRYSHPAPAALYVAWNGVNTTNRAIAYRRGYFAMAVNARCHLRVAAEEAQSAITSYLL
jgi:hypothetical protein